MHFSVNIAVEQEVIVAAIVIALCLFTVHALLMHSVHQHTFNRSRVAIFL